MAKHWMAKAFANAHGQLHQELHVPLDKTTPREKLERAKHSSNPKLRRRALAASNANPLRK
ncbi:MAG: hypothetical protein ACLQFT_12460 [Steroidobacteraceae bacterium]|jgi:hypothetical protein